MTGDTTSCGRLSQVHSPIVESVHQQAISLRVRGQLGALFKGVDVPFGQPRIREQRWNDLLPWEPFLDGSHDVGPKLAGFSHGHSGHTHLDDVGARHGNAQSGLAGSRSSRLFFADVGRHGNASRQRLADREDVKRVRRPESRCRKLHVGDVGPAFDGG